MREVGWLSGDRRFPGELRLPDVACIIRVEAGVQRGGTLHTETRYYIASADLDAANAAEAVRGHWSIENGLHWVIDVGFGEDQSRLRKGSGAKNMAVVRHFALNLVRAAKDKKSIKLRRKLAGWTPSYLDALLKIRRRLNWIRSPGEDASGLDQRKSRAHGRHAARDEPRLFVTAFESGRHQIGGVIPSLPTITTVAVTSGPPSHGPKTTT